MSIDNCILDTTSFQNKRIWECQTETDALVLFYNKNVTINDNDQVCYLTGSSNVYTCYQRPPGTTLNIDDGQYYANDSTKDTTPAGIEFNMQGVCSDYNSEGARFVNVLDNTQSTMTIISDASKRISYTTQQLIDMSTTYCASGVTRKQNFVDFCTTLKTGIDIYVSLPKGNYGLNYISTTIKEGIYASTNNLYTNIYKPAYNGYQCQT